MTLVEQLRCALESGRTDAQVRTWLWIKLVMGGEAEVMAVMAQFGTDKTLAELIRIKLVSVRGTKVIAGDWGEGSRSEITTIPSRRKVFSPKGSVTTESLDSCETSITPKRASSQDELDPTPTHPSSKKTRKAPAKRGKLSGLSGRELSKAAFESPRVAGAKEAISSAIGWVFRRYNEGRKRAGVRPLPAKLESRYRGQWRKVAEFVLENDVAIDEFIDWAYKRTSFMPAAFPPPHLMAGPWLAGEWENRDETRPSRVAGHTYKKADDGTLRERLLGAGFDVAEMTEDELDFVAEEAEVLSAHPQHYTPDPDWHPLVQWVVDQEPPDEDQE